MWDVDAPGEGVQHGGIAGDHGLAVAGRVLRDVGNGLPGAAHDAHGQYVVQEFGVEVILSGGLAGDDGRGFGVQPQLDGIVLLFGLQLRHGGERLGQHGDGIFILQQRGQAFGVL